MSSSKLKVLPVPALLALALIGCQGSDPSIRSAVADRVVVTDRTKAANEITTVVSDPASVAALESHFPGYHKRPKSNTAAGYEAQYVFQFELPDGSSVRVVSNGTADLWSAGHGDFPVEGDLKKTIARLQQPTS